MAWFLWYFQARGNGALVLVISITWLKKCLHVKIFVGLELIETWARELKYLWDLSWLRLELENWNICGTWVDRGLSWRIEIFVGLELIEAWAGELKYLWDSEVIEAWARELKYLWDLSWSRLELENWNICGTWVDRGLSWRIEIFEGLKLIEAWAGELKYLWDSGVDWGLS